MVEILKQGKIDPATMDDEKKRETVENYIAFKNLMFKIDKDEDEYDDDGNLIPNHPQVPPEAAICLSGQNVHLVFSGLCQGASKPWNAISWFTIQPFQWILSSTAT